MNLRGAPHDPVGADAEITVQVSKNFGNWLNDKRVCLLISSYQSGRLLIVGADINSQVLIQQHKFDRAMGISAYKGGFAFGTLHQIWRFSLINPLDKTKSGGQPLLLPQHCHYTGFVNCHDVARKKITKSFTLPPCLIAWQRFLKAAT